MRTVSETARYTLAVILALLTVLLFCLPTAAAGDAESVYTVSQTDDHTILLQKQGEEMTFWEAPSVSAGQSRTGGRLVLRNETEETMSLWLDAVELPYDNEAALRYLDYVSVDISENGKTCYHGTLSRIAEGLAGVRLEAVAPGEERVLSVEVNCAYTYEGDVPAFSSLIWQFNTSVKQEPDPVVTSPEGMRPGADDNGVLLAIKVAGGILGGAVLIGLVVVLLSMRRPAGRHGKR